MGSQSREDSWQGGSWRIWNGEAAAGGVGEVVAIGPGVPTFAWG